MNNKQVKLGDLLSEQQKMDLERAVPVPGVTILNTKLSIPLDKILLNKNSRKEYRDVEMSELMTGMKQIGLMQPIGVHKILGADMFELVFGFRRYYAAQKLGWKTIDANLIEVTDEKDRITKNLIENVLKSEVSFTEIGSACSDLLKLGLTHSEIAARIAKPKHFVMRALEVFGHIPVKYRDKISLGNRGAMEKKGQIPATTALHIVNLKRRKRLNTDQTEKLLKFATEDKTSREMVQQAANLMAEGMPTKDAIKKAEEIKVVTLTFMMQKSRIKLLEKRYDCTVHDIAYSWLEQNQELKIILNESDRRDSKVISHTVTRKTRGTKEE